MHRNRGSDPGCGHRGAISYAQQAGSGKPINWGEVAGAAATGAILGGVAGAVGGVGLAGAWGFSGGAAALAATTSVVATDAVGVGLTAGGVVGGVAGIAASDAADCGLSFRADTPIATPKGNQAISTLKAGDKVQAYDSVTKKVSTQSVQHVFINHDKDLIDVTLALHPSENQIKQRQVAKVSHSNHNPPLITEVIHTTQKHPWLTTHGWTIAGQLHLNDQVQQLDGTTATVVALKIISGTADMYDLTVSNVHTFAVGTGQFVVHNCPWWPGAGKATRASYSIQVKPGVNVPQAVRDVVLRTALAQNFEGGRSPNNACCGTFIITDSTGKVVYDPAEVYLGNDTKGGGGLGGSHAESLEASDAADWLRANAQSGQSYTVNFVNQYKPCQGTGGCMAAITGGDWDTELNAAAATNGASASSAFYVQGSTGNISVYAQPSPVDPVDPELVE